MGNLSLREYGLIGNTSSTALVSRMGSVDWCCLPHLDSPSHFGGLLDELAGGKFQVMPLGEFFSAQRYLPRTNVIETKFEVPTGIGILTDWMPIDGSPVLRRKIEMLEGIMTWSLVCSPRFRYGADPTHAELHRAGVLFRGAHSEDIATLHSDVPVTIRADGTGVSAQFELKKGDTRELSWGWGRQKTQSQRECDPQELQNTTDFWKNWAHRCEKSGCLLSGPWHEAAARSGLVLKLLSAGFSGGIVESATTSLPTITGGSRNWDYRFVWLRDCAWAIESLLALGHSQEAHDFFNWISDVVTRDGADGLQPVYTLDGGKFLPEHEITSLSGYQGARPVRIGNQSARHFQLDIYGHVLLAAAQRYEHTQTIDARLWEKLTEITEFVSQAWRRPDRGTWEVRTKPEHFVSSKVMCWVALDRACRLARAQGFHVPQRWIDERETLHKTICQQGFDERRRSFVRAFGDRELDASVLLIPLLGFLPPEDPRVQGTLDAIQNELSEGVLIHRNRPEHGLTDSDGAHLLCSFWFVSCLARSGRVSEASDRLAELCTFATPQGLFGEQIHGGTGEVSGNFPCASSHLALVHACLSVGIAKQELAKPGLRAVPNFCPLPGDLGTAALPKKTYGG